MDLYDQAVANTWFPNEIQLGEDIADFKKMTDEERHAVTFLMSYFNPNELLVNKALAFGVYPYVNAAEATPLPRQADVGGGQPLHDASSTCSRRSRSTATRPTTSHVDVPSMARKEEFEVTYIRRMTEQTLDITTTEGKQDFIRNLVAYNVILEGIWFYSGFMVALRFRQRNLLRNFGSLIDWVVRDESLHLQVRHQPHPHGARGEPRPADRGVRRRDRQMILDAVEMEEAVQPRPAAERHPRSQRRLHQPVREVPGRPSARGARLRDRTTTCRTRRSGWRRPTTPCSS